MSLGRFITFEGGEGAGKTTHLQFIHDYLLAHHIPVIATREPGGTKIAEKIRDLLLQHDEEVLTEQAELLLIFAARAQHYHTVIQPALSQGQWVLCDRFTDATYAYQGGGRNMDVKTIAWLEQLVLGQAKPDLTLLFDVPVEVGMARARARGKLDRFERENDSFFQNVRRAYLLQAKLDSQRIRIINANQPLIDVQRELLTILTPWIKVDQK